MKPNQIRAELLVRDLNVAAIAKIAGVSRQFVNAVIRRNRVNSRVELIIASAIGKPVSEVFPDTKK